MNIVKVFKQSINYIKKEPMSLLSPKKLYKNTKKFIKRMTSKTVNPSFYNPYDKFEYNLWLKHNKNISVNKKMDYKPLISVIIPVYNISPIYLSKCIDSVLNQTYDNFEICIVDDKSTNIETIECLKKYENNPKIKIEFSDKNENISSTTNKAIKMAHGEFISLLDNDDTLDKYALEYVVDALNKDKKLDFIYTDEDKINEKDERFDPFFKPDWSPNTILSFNYICHFVTIRKSIFEKVGYFRSEYDGCQDYDMFLRITENTNKIYHISKILYHWRTLSTSTSTGINKKDNISFKTKKMLEDAMQRRNIHCDIKINDNGTFKVNYKLDKEPLISIIIPTKDHADILKNCIDSIINKTIYKNYEIIIVNNNSSIEETFTLFNEYKNNYNFIKVIDANCEFNYSYINNLAVKESKGEYIVLLNNDTEIISSDWLNQMVSYASQKNIGIVGAKLLYSDNTIQHGGVIIGLGGVAGHAFINEDVNYNGPFSWLQINRDVGGVTAACLMVKKSIYNEVGGLEENLRVAFNDVDFNLKVLDKGYNNLFLADVLVYHLESKSRGLEDTKEKIERFNSEVKYMQDKWKDKLKRDPYYNDTLSYLYNYKLDIK